MDLLPLLEVMSSTHPTPIIIFISRGVGLLAIVKEALGDSPSERNMGSVYAGMRCLLGAV
jgi:hypothetical protein